MYERWLDCFVATIAKVDPECDPALEAAWREALRPGISAIGQHVTAAAPRSQRR
jgi:hypothetical protein